MSDEWLDKAAVYESKTETIRTGNGLHVRIRDLRDALQTLKPYALRRLARDAGISAGVANPVETGCADAVQDIVELVRSMPQYCLPVVQAGIGPEFEALLRDRRFGVSAIPDVQGVVNQQRGRIGSSSGDSASYTPTRSGEAKWHDALGRFFWDTEIFLLPFYLYTCDCRQASDCRLGGPTKSAS